MSVEELKILQLQIIKRDKICNIVGVLLFLFSAIILWIVYLSKYNLIELTIMVILIDLIFCLIITAFVKRKVNSADIEKFYKEFKNIFVLESLKNFFTDIVYYPEKGFSRKFVDNIGMIDTGDSFNSNDYISGKYKNISFEQADVHIQEEHEEKDKDGKTYTVWETTFLGRVMIFDFNKKFKANIQVASYRFDAGTLPWSKKFSVVTMEDIEFNNSFNVYAENEHEAFYILTPHFMEKIKELTKKINCGIMFCFVENKLHIAVDNYENSFECSVFDPIDETKVEEDILRDIRLITNFVDELNLDSYLFNKTV